MWKKLRSEVWEEFYQVYRTHEQSKEWTDGQHRFGADEMTDRFIKKALAALNHHYLAPTSATKEEFQEAIYQAIHQVCPHLSHRFKPFLQPERGGLEDLRPQQGGAPSQEGPESQLQRAAGAGDAESEETRPDAAADSTVAATSATSSMNEETFGSRLMAELGQITSDSEPLDFWNDGWLLSLSDVGTSP